MPGIPSWLATLLGILLESIFYGFFVLLYVINLVAANVENTVPVYRQRMIQVSTLMLALATAHLVIAFVKAAHGFTPVDGKIPLGLFTNLDDPMYRAKIAIYFMQTIMADALMVWRCYVVYDRIWWILIPGALGILLDIATLVVRLLPAKLPVDAGALAINGLIPLGFRIAFLSTTMALHLSCSTAIVVKIYLTRRCLRATTRKISPVIIAIIESAAIYTIAVFLLLLFNLLQSFGQFVVMDVIIPLVGIVFCLIAIRIRFYLRASPVADEVPTIGARALPWSAPPLETVINESYSQNTPIPSSADASFIGNQSKKH